MRLQAQLESPDLLPELLVGPLDSSNCLVSSFGCRLDDGRRRPLLAYLARKCQDGRLLVRPQDQPSKTPVLDLGDRRADHVDVQALRSHGGVHGAAAPVHHDKHAQRTYEVVVHLHLVNIAVSPRLQVLVVNALGLHADRAPRPAGQVRQSMRLLLSRRREHWNLPMPRHRLRLRNDLDCCTRGLDSRRVNQDLLWNAFGCSFYGNSNLDRHDLLLPKACKAVSIHEVENANTNHLHLVLGLEGHGAAHHEGTGWRENPAHPTVDGLAD